MLRNYLHWFVGTYGFSNSKEFLLSLCPSFRYNIQSVTIPFSLLTGLCSAVFGIGPVVVFAMFVAVLVETFTGLKASHKRGEPFESYKFSRCIIKVAVWLTLVFILNSFARDMDARESWLYSVGSFFFDSAKLAVLTYFCVEYVTSILENLSVIDGKPKDALISAIKDKWSVMINLLKNKNEK